MKKDKATAKAIGKSLKTLEYVIVACEFDEQGNIGDRLLTKLYAAKELLTLAENELKRIGAI